MLLRGPCRGVRINKREINEASGGQMIGELDRGFDVRCRVNRRLKWLGGKQRRCEAPGGLGAPCDFDTALPALHEEPHRTGVQVDPGHCCIVLRQHGAPDRVDRVICADEAYGGMGHEGYSAMVRRANLCKSRYVDRLLIGGVECAAYRPFQACHAGKIGEGRCWPEVCKELRESCAVVAKVSASWRFLFDEDAGGTFEELTPHKAGDRRKGKPQGRREPPDERIAID